jgi:cytochrome b6-f complex iron-sulfur subunit
MLKKHCRKNSPVLHDHFMASMQKRQETTRRQFLRRLIKGIMVISATAFIYPLLRFTGFTVKPKPRYIVIRKNIPFGGSYTEHDFILFQLEKGPIAISRRCTHLGCRVHYRQELELIECPCHQSRFTLTGERISGPAKNNLAFYPVRLLQDDKGEVSGYEVTI